MSKNSAGRPEWKPTKAQREQISIAAAGGMAHDAIATAMGIARGTLEKHCGDELNVGACKRRFEMLNAMFNTGLAGNVTAQKAFLAAGDAGMGLPPPDRPDAAKPLGKKELAVEDAKTAQAGTEWSELLTHGQRPN